MLDKLKNLFIIEEEDKSTESGNVVEKTAADAAQSNTSSQKRNDYSKDSRNTTTSRGWYSTWKRPHLNPRMVVSL